MCGVNWTLLNMTIPDPPVLHPNEINAIYWQMRNNGQFYIGQLGRSPISIEEWRDLAIRKLEPAQAPG
jgi:hypothetical protein